MTQVPPLSMSPSGSPHVETSGTSRSSLHSHLMKWIERKVNRNIMRNPFEQQERQARSHSLAPGVRFVPGKQRDSDPLTAILRQEHKVIPAGKSILRLPRLPFGCHRTYNEEQSFTEQHFVNCESPSAQNGQLEALTKLYRLADKRKAKKAKFSPSALRSPKLEPLDFVESDHGTIYFPKQKRMLRAYENDRNRYKKALELTFRQVNEELSPHVASSTHHRGQSLLSPSRLYPGPRPERESRLSVTMAHKYSKLFDAGESLESATYAL